MIAVKWMKTHARTIGASVAMPVSLDINLPKDRLTLSVSEVSKLLGLSRSATYEAIRQGQIPSIRFGKKILVSRVRLEMMLRESK
jgi:excisionase family DNA binding protein